MAQPASPISASPGSNAPEPSSNLPNIDKILRAIRAFFERLRDGGRWAWNALTSRRVVAISGAIEGTCSVVSWVSPRAGNRLARFLTHASMWGQAVQAQLAEDAFRAEIARLQADRGAQDQRVAASERAQGQAERRAREAKANLTRQLEGSGQRIETLLRQRDEAVQSAIDIRLSPVLQAVERTCAEIREAHGKGDKLASLYTKLIAEYGKAHDTQMSGVRGIQETLPTGDLARNWLESLGSLLGASSKTVIGALQASEFRALMKEKGSPMSPASDRSRMLEDHIAQCQVHYRANSNSTDTGSHALLQKARELVDQSIAMARKAVEVANLQSSQ